VTVAEIRAERHARLKAAMLAVKQSAETRGAKARPQTGSVELAQPSRRARMLREGERAVNGVRMPLDF
jgi:hypothetical protein